MERARFAVNWDYRCPFARNAHEHVVTALEDGADWEVEFVPFSLSQIHVPEGGRPVWEDPDKRLDLLAPLVGTVMRDRFADSFRRVHLALFRARHDEALDLRDEAVLRQVLTTEGVDPGPVFNEVGQEWPLETLRQEHESWAEKYQAFGVPTFLLGQDAVFVRIMTRPEGDAGLARTTIEAVLDLVVSHPDLNEVKRTTIHR